MLFPQSLLYLVQYLLLLGADMVEVVAGSDIHERGGFSGFYIVHEQLYVAAVLDVERS